MWALLKTATIATVVPLLATKVASLIEDAWDYVFDDADEPEEKKVPDRTKLTPEQIKHVREAHRTRKGTCTELTKELNKKFNTNKSMGTFAKYWNQKETK